MKHLASLFLIFSVFITSLQAGEISKDSFRVSTKPNEEELIPKHIQKWLDNKTAFKKGKTNTNVFFRRDSIRIVGYIKGYFPEKFTVDYWKL